MAIAILKNTHKETIVKVYGGDSTSETVDLSTILATGQILDGATQTVSISGVTWTGDNNSIMTITRNSVAVLTMPGTGASTIDFTGQQLPLETTENTSDLVISIAGGIGQVYVKLRKVSGYTTTIEPEQFGSYDNPAVAGS